jgi:hypothetical protein
VQVYAEAEYEVGGGSDGEEGELGNNFSLNISHKHARPMVSNVDDESSFENVCAESSNLLPSEILETLEDLSWVDESVQVLLLSSTLLFWGVQKPTNRLLCCLCFICSKGIQFSSR